MRLRRIGRPLGFTLLCEAGFMLLPALLSLCRLEPSGLAFLPAIGLLLAAGIPLARLSTDASPYSPLDGLTAVALSWLLLSLFGGLPFLFSGAVASPIDAWFETVSGFTTTGATILTDVEALPWGLLLWRSLTQWIGGLGFVVFLLLLLPRSQGSTLHLWQAESASLGSEKLAPRLRTGAGILCLIYLLLTAAETALLTAGGMPLFDSVNHALATAGTGGFSVRNGNIAAYGSPVIEWIVAVFMLLFGVNLNVFYWLALGRFKRIWRSEEWRWYLGLFLLSFLLLAGDLLRAGLSGAVWRQAFFQAANAVSTTGFYTADFAAWPALSRFLLMAVMVAGVSTGSSGGGIKTARLIVMVKAIGRDIRQAYRPHVVRAIKLDGQAVSERVVRGVLCFILTYVTVAVVSTLLLLFDGHDITTNATAVIACMNNFGTGLAGVGPTSDYTIYSAWSKLVLSCDMLLGRLEIFPLLVLFSPSTWRHYRLAAKQTRKA